MNPAPFGPSNKNPRENRNKWSFKGVLGVEMVFNGPFLVPALGNGILDMCIAIGIHVKIK